MAEAKWRDRAACRGMSPSTFYPEDFAGVVAAKKICAACSCTEECLELAIVNNESEGIWGGQSARSLRRIRRQRRKSAA